LPVTPRGGTAAVAVRDQAQPAQEAKGQDAVVAPAAGRNHGCDERLQVDERRLYAERTDLYADDDRDRRNIHAEPNRHADRAVADRKTGEKHACPFEFERAGMSACFCWCRIPVRNQLIHLERAGPA
jgi:hypothetical protein